MTVMQQYRLWLRRAPAANKAVAGLAAALAVALLAWLVTPVTGSNDTVALDGSSAPGDPSGQAPGTTSSPTSAPVGSTGGTGTSTAGTATPTGTGGTTGTTTGTAGSTTGVAAPGTGSTGSTGSTGTGTTSGGTTGPVASKCPGGTDQGVTASEVRVAAGLIDIPGVNQAYNIPSPELQQKWYDLVIAEVNKNGGAGCRKIKPTYYHVNLVDQNNLQQNCKSIVASKPFAYLDDGAYLTAAAKECFPSAKLLYIGPAGADQALLNKYYPYIIVTGGALEQSLHNAFQGFKRYGKFSASDGFKKEGLIFRSCNKQTKPLGYKELGLAGVASDKIVDFNLGCPSGSSSPSSIQQAVLKFQQAGVTHVSLMDMVGDHATFTKIAQQQQYKPKYVTPDYGYIATAGPTGATNKPDPNNWDGATLVSPGSFGYRPAESAATKWCNSIYTKAGQPKIYDQGAGLGGIICNNLILFTGAASHAPSMMRTALADGIQKTGKVDFSWPNGPGDYSGYHVTHGGQYWRSVTYSKACDCYQARESDWQAPFT